MTGTGSQGASHYAAPNPEFGATFTYYIKDVPTSVKAARQKAEADAKEKGVDITYQTYAQFVAEDNYEDAYILFVIRDAAGNEINKIKTNASSGVNRITWDLRYPTTNPLQLQQGEVCRYSNLDVGPIVLPGMYSVELYLSENGVITKLH